VYISLHGARRPEDRGNKMEQRFVKKGSGKVVHYARVMESLVTGVQSLEPVCDEWAVNNGFKITELIATAATCKHCIKIRATR
jgi:hypothetical protein